jgi:hypothetical protein
VMTWWHPDDLAGILLREEPDVWTHVNIPASDTSLMVCPYLLSFDRPALRIRRAAPPLLTAAVCPIGRNDVQSLILCGFCGHVRLR